MLKGQKSGVFGHDSLLFPSLVCPNFKLLLYFKCQASMDWAYKQFYKPQVFNAFYFIFTE